MHHVEEVCDQLFVDWMACGRYTQDASYLRELVINALMTDRRRNIDDASPDGSNRGWWAGEFGSRLWLIEGGIKMSDTLQRSRDYVNEALAFLIADSLVEDLDVTAAYVDGGVNIEICATLSDRGQMLVTLCGKQNNKQWTWAPL